MNFSYQVLVIWVLMVSSVLTYASDSCAVYASPIGALKGHRGIIQTLKILKNGSLASGSADWCVRLWDVKCGIPQESTRIPDRQLTKGKGPGVVGVIEELSDGRIACQVNCDGLSILDCNTYELVELPNLEGCYSGGDIKLLSDGKIAVTSSYEVARFEYKKCIKIWDIVKDQCEKIFKTDSSAFISSIVELKKVQRLVAASWNKTICMWNINDPSADGEILRGHQDCLNAIVQLDDDTLASASDDSTVKIWNVLEKKEKITLSGHTDRVYTLLAVKGKIISGSRDMTVKVWDPITGQCLLTMPCNDKIYSLAFSPENNRLFVGLGHGDIKVFQLQV